MDLKRTESEKCTLPNNRNIQRTSEKNVQNCSISKMVYILSFSASASAHTHTGARALTHRQWGTRFTIGGPFTFYDMGFDTMMMNFVSCIVMCVEVIVDAKLYHTIERERKKRTRIIQAELGLADEMKERERDEREKQTRTAGIGSNPAISFFFFVYFAMLLFFARRSFRTKHNWSP